MYVSIAVFSVWICYLASILQAKSFDTRQLPITRLSTYALHLQEKAKMLHCGFVIKTLTTMLQTKLKKVFKQISGFFTFYPNFNEISIRLID